MTKSARVTLVVGIACLAAAGVTLLRGRYIFSYRITFSTLPADDSKLVQTLTAEPGVSNVQVTRNTNDVSITFETPWWQSVTAVDVFHDAESCGYGGPGNFGVRYSTSWKW